MLAVQMFSVRDARKEKEASGQIKAVKSGK